MNIERERKILRTLDYIVGLNDADRVVYLQKLREHDEVFALEIMNTLRVGKDIEFRPGDAIMPE